MAGRLCMAMTKMHIGAHLLMQHRWGVLFGMKELKYCITSRIEKLLKVRRVLAVEPVATKTTFEKTDDKDNAPGKEVGLDKSDPKAIDFLLFDDTDER
jgi:hypothetical protein